MVLITESATPRRANDGAPPRRKLCPLYRSALGTRAATNAWRNALVSALRVSGLPSSIANNGESSLILYRRLILASMYLDIALAGHVSLPFANIYMSTGSFDVLLRGNVTVSCFAPFSHFQLPRDK